MKKMKKDNYVYSKVLGTADELKKIMKKLGMGGAVIDYKGNSHKQGGIDIDKNYNAVSGGKNNRQSKMYSTDPLTNIEGGEIMIDMNKIMLSKDPIARQTAILAMNKLKSKNELLKSKSSKNKMAEGGVIDPPEDGDFLKGLIDAGVITDYSSERFGMDIPYDDMNKLLAAGYNKDYSALTPYYDEINKLYASAPGDEIGTYNSNLTDYVLNYGEKYDSYVKTVPSDNVNPSVPSPDTHIETPQPSSTETKLSNPTKLPNQGFIDTYRKMMNPGGRGANSYQDWTKNINSMLRGRNNIIGEGVYDIPNLNETESVKNDPNLDPNSSERINSLATNENGESGTFRVNPDGSPDIANPYLPEINGGINSDDAQSISQNGLNRFFKDPIKASAAVKMGLEIPRLLAGPEKEISRQNKFNSEVRSLARQNRVDLDPLRRTAINQRNAQTPNTRSATINQAVSANLNNQLTSNLQNIDTKQQEMDAGYRSRLMDVLSRTGEMERAEDIRKQTADSQNKAAYNSILSGMGSDVVELGKYQKALNVRDRMVKDANTVLSLLPYVSPEIDPNVNGGIKFNVNGASDKDISDQEKKYLKYLNSLPEDVKKALIEKNNG